MAKKNQRLVAELTFQKEFTPRALILGVILGLVFGVGNTYLGLKVGTTVSASIPAAVVSMAVLRFFFRGVSILENNLVQTIASVGEGLAAGVIFTAPALFLIGDTPDLFRLFLLTALGGVLGVLFMIPMRRYIIVKEHGVLPFPEGTACAEILKSGENSAKKAVMAFLGIVTGCLYKIASNGLNLWKETVSWTFPRLGGVVFSMDCTPALMGVGYIIGIRIAALLFSGGILGYWVLIPLIKNFGHGIIYPSLIPVESMDVDQIWSSYIRYIGAGTVAAGGVVSLCKIAPLIGKIIHHSFKELFFFNGSGPIVREDRDISLRWLLLGSLAIVITLWLWPSLPMNLFTIILMVILAFFFVAVTSLTVGVVGSTSNPVSGMTITTLLITCIVFMLLGWTERFYLIAAITMAIVANVAICMAATTSQDLKTGFLVRATPRYQQIGEILGVVFPSLAIGGTLLLLHTTYGFGSKELPAPQGTMIFLLAKGVMQGEIPVALVSTGFVLGLILALMQVPILPFAIGLYLPLSLSTPIMLGSLVSYLIGRCDRDSETHEKGVLASSGLIAGDACTGVLLALFTFFYGVKQDGGEFLGNEASISLFVLLAVALFGVILLSKSRKGRI